MTDTRQVRTTDTRPSPEESNMTEPISYPNLSETFADPASRVEKTVVVVDINGSTAMKEATPQAAWVTQTGWLYDLVAAQAAAANVHVDIKYLGDGIMVVFDADHATQAVNFAIRVQESIRDAGQGQNGGAGVVQMTCSVGISSGEVIRFATPGGSVDYIGTQVDKAFRLCSAANQRAIFIDAPTLGAANQNRFRARVGVALGWAADQYVGEVQRVTLKGFAQPVSYYELKHTDQLFGVASAEVTASTDRFRASQTLGSVQTLPTPIASSPRVGIERCHGKVTCWRADKKFGFVKDAAGTSFHFTTKALVYEDSISMLAVGLEVSFVHGPAPKTGNTPEAGAILVNGEEADGPLVSLPEGRPYGWIRVEDELGNRQLVYVPKREIVGRTVGDLLGFTVMVNDHGATATKVELIEQDEAA